VKNRKLPRVPGQLEIEEGRKHGSVWPGGEGQGRGKMENGWKMEQWGERKCQMGEGGEMKGKITREPS